MSYKYFASQKKKNVADCSVRSMMAAEGMTWEQAYNELCAMGLKKLRMPNELETIQACLKTHGYEPEKAPMKDTADGHKKRYTVKEFAKANKKATCILSLSGHVVCIKNGNWYDTWDCADMKVFKVFRKVA